MKNNYYYTVEEGELPMLTRTDYHGYKFDEVINGDGVRTFRQAKSNYKKYLKQLMKECEAELSKVDKLEIEDLETDTVL